MLYFISCVSGGVIALFSHHLDMPGDKKICWCKPTCGKLRARRTRRRHYKREDPAEQESSQSAASDVEMNTSSHSVSSDTDHIPDSSTNIVSDDSSTNDEHDLESDHDFDMPDFSDSESHATREPMDIEPDASSDESDVVMDEEWVGFDEELDADIPVSLEEMGKELDEMLFSEDEQALWEIRASIFST